MRHYGQCALQILHQYTEGVLNLRDNAFYKYPSCMTRNFCIDQPVRKLKRKNTKQQHIATISSPPISKEPPDDVYLPDTFPGRHFHMDFRLVRGSELKETREG